MPKVVMYALSGCPYCVRARRLLNNKSVTYTEISVDGNPAVRAEMSNKSKRHTVPQISIDDLHVGGFDDLQVLDQEGRLDSLLEPR